MRDEEKRRSEFYNDFRDALINRYYYCHRLSTVKGYNLFLEIIIALGTSSTIAGLAIIWKADVGELLIAVIASIAAVFGVIKPIIQISNRVEKYTVIATVYRILAFNLTELKDQIIREDNYSTKLHSNFATAVNIKKSLVLQTESPEKNRLIQKYTKIVDEEINPSDFWKPVVNRDSKYYFEKVGA